MQGLRENGYSIVGEEESPQSSHRGYVSERGDGIVCEIDGIVLVLQKMKGIVRRQITSEARRERMRYRLTLVTPRFSIAGIL